MTLTKMAYVLQTEDYNDVIEVCNQIGIPYYAVNFEKNIGIKSLPYFLDEYKKVVLQTQTLCNKEIQV